MLWMRRFTGRGIKEVAELDIFCNCEAFAEWDLRDRLAIQKQMVTVWNCFEFEACRNRDAFYEVVIFLSQFHHK